MLYRNIIIVYSLSSKGLKSEIEHYHKKLMSASVGAPLYGHELLIIIDVLDHMAIDKIY